MEFYGADICVGDGGVWDETTGECITPEEAEAREAAAAKAKAEKEAKRLAR